ncbi:MAG: hypothetical protein AAB409_03390 [Gemmatimonadota bacterium]
MFTSCAFCSGALGGNGGPSGLGVGRKFSFDPWKSRAWVICQRCSRWNLTPVDERLDTIAALDRMAAGGRVAAASAQVALIRVGPYDVVRVGKPPRVEMATWRYGERLKARERERMKVIVPVAVAVIGVSIAINAAAGGSMGAFMGQIPNIANGVYIWTVGRRKVAIEPPICARCGRVMVLRSKQLKTARLQRTAHTDLALLVICPSCKGEGALLEGGDAETALRSGLTYVNLRQSRKLKKKAEAAAQQVDASGGPESFLVREAQREVKLETYKGAEALALEMAVDEQAELRELERQWRDAEEIADIADNLLVDPAIENALRHLKQGDQPGG